MILHKNRKFIFKKKYIKNNFLVIVSLFAFFVFTLLLFFNMKIRPKIENIIIYNVNKSIYDYIFNMFSLDTLVNEDIMNIINMQKNENDEIIAVDYNFSKAYEYLSKGMTNLYKDIDKINIKMDGFDKQKKVLFIPSGMGSNNIFLENMGFKVPCKIKLMSSVNMGFKTKVSNYGINNLLMELYVVITTKNQLVVPYKEKEFGNTYEIIIASKVIIGNIPIYYGDTIEKSSAIISS